MVQKTGDRKTHPTNGTTRQTTQTTRRTETVRVTMRSEPHNGRPGWTAWIGEVRRANATGDWELRYAVMDEDYDEALDKVRQWVSEVCPRSTLAVTMR